MKKWLLILGMITCMLGLTACGQQNKEADDLMSDQEARDYVESVATVVSQVVNQQGEESYIAMVEQNGVDGTVFENAFASWKSASEDMGNYVEVVKVTNNSVVVEEYQGTRYPEEGVLTAEIKCDKRNATIEVVFEDGMPVSVTTNVIYSFGEKMEKAALNTLLGMGTVFVVLILISGIISCFSLIPKLQAKFSKKSAKQEAKSAAVDNTIAQIIEKEELTDDLELVAVIAAAIAASEGASSTDGFVVRSIRRVGSKWQKA
ncbi:MAG: OadG family transporter subunit [Suilimivivens sp.]